ncbi:unnamed protein product [Lota lota]
MVVEDMVVSLSGGAPWGFRLQGGAEHQRPLQVAKVRRRSKACRAGLKEDDELVAIGDQTCTELSHGQAMNLIDMQRATLNLRVKRGSGFSVSSAISRAAGRGMLSPPVGGGVCITSPPDSEAYYGETDSDADIQSPAHRRQRRTPPHPRSPARCDSRDEEETTSEMSGYESAPDGGGFLHALWEPTRPLEGLPGVPRRELVYQPPEERTATPVTHMPPTLTPRTLTPTLDQGLMEGEGEVDSGFQEAGSCVPLVSLERAKEAMMMGSSRQLVPMVGPQLGPISDELSSTYVDKAKQAKLHRGESVVEKQVKEARTKCRSIASLLTDAPNSNSKGVLMFKKRRQRAKKYTLTCFGKAEGEDTEGDTGGETEEEGGSSVVSGSEVEEEDFSASYDSTWDSGYLDLLDRMSAACPHSTPTTPTTPTTNHNPGLDVSAYQSPGSAYTGFNGVAFQGPRLENGSTKQPIAAHVAPTYAPMSPHAAALTNGASLVVSQASVVLTPPTQTPSANQAGHQHHQQQPTAPGVSANRHLDPAMNSEHIILAVNPNSNAAGVLNRTARPFASGPSAARSPVAPVAFRPPQPRPTAVAMATKPVTAVSAVTIQPQRPLPEPESRRAVSTTSLYISPRSNGNNNGLAVISPPPRHSSPSPPSSLASAQPLAQPMPFSPHFSGPPASFPPPSTPFSPSSSGPPLAQAAQGPPSYQSAAQPFSHPSPTQAQPFSHPSPPQAQPFSHPSPPQAQPFSHPSPTQAQPFSHPSPTQAQPFSHPSPPQAQPFSHPSPPQAQPFSHPSPPHAQPFSHPSPPHSQPFSPTSQSYPSPNGSAHLPPSSGVPANHTAPVASMATAGPQQPSPHPHIDSLASREQRISVPAARTGILQDARRRANAKPMFCSVQNKDVSPNPALLSMLQNMDAPSEPSPGHGAPGGDAGHESGPEEDWLRLGAEACNFMQAQRGPRPPPVAPKPQVPQVPQMPQMEGKGGQLFARRQSRMDRYVVDRSPSVAAMPYSPAQTREASPTPSLPATWKYSSSIRAPPPISYNPLLSPSCPLKAQKSHKAEAGRAGHTTGSKPAAKKGGLKPLEIMTHQPYQLNSSLFTYVPGAPQMTSNHQHQQQQQQQRSMMGTSLAPMKTARVREVKRFSTPPPVATGPSLKVLIPRSVTSLGEPTWRSEPAFPPSAPAPAFSYQPPPAHPQPGGPACYFPQPSQWASSPLSPPAPPAPTAPLPQLPNLTSVHQTGPRGAPMHVPTFSHLQGSGSEQANRQFISVPDLSPTNGHRPASRSSQSSVGGPRPRFSTSNLGLQPCVWRPGASMH